MATIAGTLNAGAWIFTGATVAAIAVAIILQVIKDNIRMETLRNPDDKTAKLLAKFLHTPPTTVILLTLATVAFFTKALAYWGMFFGVGVTGANFWGSQLGWIFYWYFISLSAGFYVCLRNEWFYVIPWGFAASAGAFFVATFAAPANQLAFVLLGSIMALILLVAVSLFGIRKDGWMIVEMVLFALLAFVGYVLPYILSPQYQNVLSTLNTLIWYLVADCFAIVWVVIAVATALDCAQVTNILEKSLGCEPKPSCNKPSKLQQ